MSIIVLQLTILWSAFGFCAVTEEDIATDAFTSAKSIEGSQRIEIGNLPRVRSQGVAPFCTEYSTATMFQHRLCKNRKVVDCSQVPKNLEISPISLSVYSQDPTQGKALDMFTSYKRLDFDFDARAYNPQLLAADIAAFRPESCFNSDAWLNSFPSPKDLSKTVATVNAIYTKYKGTEANCTECMSLARSEIRAALGLDRSEKEIKDALGGIDPKQFIYGILFSNFDCPYINMTLKLPIKRLPENPDILPTKKEMMTKALAVLEAQKSLVQLGGICLYRKKSGECSGSHTLVLTGVEYDPKSCLPDFGPQCKINFKIQNSWGSEWQEKFTWVDGKKLFQNLGSEGKNTYSMHWLE